MIRIFPDRRLALAGALVTALSLAGATMAATPPSSTHASSTAVTAVSTHATDTDTDTDTHTGSDTGNTVSTAAQSDLTGGAHDNHGGYVSCVARGGSNCTSTNPTLPSHGEASTHVPSNPPSDVPAH